MWFMSPRSTIANISICLRQVPQFGKIKKCIIPPILTVRTCLWPQPYNFIFPPSLLVFCGSVLEFVILFVLFELFYLDMFSTLAILLASATAVLAQGAAYAQCT